MLTSKLKLYWLLFYTDFPACITGTIGRGITRTITNPGSIYPTHTACRRDAPVIQIVAGGTPNVTRTLGCVTVAGTDTLVGRHVTAVNITPIVIHIREIYVQSKTNFLSHIHEHLVVDNYSNGQCLRWN